MLASVPVPEFLAVWIVVCVTTVGPLDVMAEELLGRAAQTLEH